MKRLSSDSDRDFLTFTAKSSAGHSLCARIPTGGESSPAPLADSAQERFTDFSFALDVGETPVLTGVWSVEVRIYPGKVGGRNGRLLKPDGNWSEICVEKDRERTYGEYSLPLTGGFRLERHLLLASDAEIALLADSVVPDENDEETGRAGKSPTVDYRGWFPLAESVLPFEEKETREITLAIPAPKKVGSGRVSRTRRGGRMTSRIVPAELPEWRANDSAGEFQLDGGRLYHRRIEKGRGLFAPLVFDLSAERVKKPLTWRQLTVGEEMKPVPGEIAVGFRVQFGRDQFLFYRSLDTPTCRSVLGQHFDQDLFVAVFHPADGTVKPILELYRAK